MFRLYFLGALFISCCSIFWSVAYFQDMRGSNFSLFDSSGRVVVDSPILIALYGGDRFLAANSEVIRLSATGMDGGVADSDYLVRAQRVVSELNPCHEDNYYLANGLLSWGGSVSIGNEILLKAASCRFWDGMPDFFYGINLSFFGRDVSGAVKAFGRSAEKWPENAAVLKKLAVMLRVEAFADENLALSYLIEQRDSAGDKVLREMLHKRVIRLQGLISLRAAQRRYEARHGPLVDLDQLVRLGELPEIPDDPLRLGYELTNGHIELRRLKIAGLE